MAAKMPDFDRLERRVLERVLLHAGERMPLRSITASKIDLAVAVDAAAKSLLISLETYMHGLAKERICINRDWPEDWWQAFRARWFPRWWLRRWPVKVDCVEVDEVIYAAVCPHLVDEAIDKHLGWLRQISLTGHEGTE